MIHLEREVEQTYLDLLDKSQGMSKTVKQKLWSVHKSRLRLMLRTNDLKLKLSNLAELKTHY